MQYRNRARQAGFTLVEIAIVLVIIGLLLGGVLKGQEMIDNSRVKAVANEMEELLGKIDKSLAATPAASDLAARWQASIGGSSELHKALELYNVQVREQKRWRASFGGSLLLAFIKLSEPSEVRVVTDLSNSRIQ